MNIPYMAGGSGFAANWYSILVSRRVVPGSGRHWSDAFHRDGLRNLMLMNSDEYIRRFGKESYYMGMARITGQLPSLFGSSQDMAYVLDEILAGYNLYVLYAFGRNNMVSSIGPIGEMGFFENGGIKFSNSTAGTHLGVAVTFTGKNNSVRQSSRRNELISEISFGTGLFTTMVGEAARGINSSVVKGIGKTAGVMGSVSGIADNSYQAYIAFSNGQYIYGGFQAYQAYLYAVVGGVLLFTPLLPVGATVLTVNSVVDMVEYLIINW